MTDEKADEQSASMPDGSNSNIPVIDVRDLMADAREAVLIHDGERYRLRLTAKDKLLLTK
jgi:hemin uptake protein HemP